MKTTLATTLALCAGLLLVGCSSAPTAPVDRAPSPRVSGTEPILHDVQVRYTGELLLVSATLSPWEAPRFSSVRDGGWCFQLFLDTDERPTGYGQGLDYLVRAIEVTPEGNIHVRRTEGGNGPGGWGESVGQVKLEHNAQRVSFMVPLVMLSDEGQAGFLLELYETIVKEDGGVYHEFVTGYGGRSNSTTHRASRVNLRTEPLTSRAARLP